MARPPKAPAYLDDIAVKQWREKSRQLAERGDLTPADWSNLELYCVNYSIYRKAVADLAARGFSIVNSQGGESRNPALSAKSDAERVMIKMASLLGFDPISRRKNPPETEEEDEPDTLFPEDSPSGILNTLIRWGWLKSDFDEKLNTYILSFPEYSQLFTELFQKLQTEDDSRERESILSIYSALFTYHSDTEKNNDILKNALQTSRRLGQLLSNMQDGMRSYFEELSQKKNFIGIQKVLVEEINNSDSKKYAILTTTDSFYRYKEAVKELVSQILRENDQKREQLVKERTGLVEGTVTSKRNQYRLEYCESASQLVYQVEREFDLIEKKYNRLIEQKTVFAKRALARIHYILQEGSSDEDHIVKLINLLDHHANSPQVLEQMRDRIRVGTQFKNITDRSFYNRKNAEDAGFHPIAMEKHNEETQMTDFVPKPLYTKKQLQEFRQKNIVDGRFVTDEQTIQSVEDLEKLLFLWQEETDDTKQEETVHIDGELKGEYGFVFSKLVIDAKKGEKK